MALVYRAKNIKSLIDFNNFKYQQINLLSIIKFRDFLGK